MSKERVGLLAALTAYGLWGLIPLYFKVVDAASALEVVSHRVVWSFFLLIPLIHLKSEWANVALVWRRWSHFGAFIITSLCIGINWLVFIYAVVSGRTLDASFGYFITPLVFILLGVVILKEELGKAQKISLALAIIGVGYQLLLLNSFPWISLLLAATFAIYGLLRKQTPIGSMAGLFIETCMLSPFALGYLIFLQQNQQLHFLHSTLSMDILLVLAGAITTVPLLLFAIAVRRLPYSTVGFFQYIAPSLHFMVAIAFLGEELSIHKLISFVIIWSALAVLILQSAFSAKS